MFRSVGFIRLSGIAGFAAIAAVALGSPVRAMTPDEVAQNKAKLDAACNGQTPAKVDAGQMAQYCRATNFAYTGVNAYTQITTAWNSAITKCDEACQQPGGNIPNMGDNPNPSPCDKAAFSAIDTERDQTKVVNTALRGMGGTPQSTDAELDQRAQEDHKNYWAQSGCTEQEWSKKRFSVKTDEAQKYEASFNDNLKQVVALASGAATSKGDTAVTGSNGAGGLSAGSAMASLAAKAGTADATSADGHLVDFDKSGRSPAISAAGDGSALARTGAADGANGPGKNAGGAPADGAGTTAGSGASRSLAATAGSTASMMGFEGSAAARRDGHGERIAGEGASLAAELTPNREADIFAIVSSRYENVAKRQSVLLVDVPVPGAPAPASAPATAPAAASAPASSRASAFRAGTY